MLLENHDRSLVVDGRQFDGWLDVRLSRGIERAADDFQIGVTQRWPGRDKRFRSRKGWLARSGSATEEAPRWRVGLDLDFRSQ